MTNQNELYHFGIKGQKWGVRRFQKKDGTLTSAGKKRYSDDTPPAKKKPKSKHQRILESKYRKAGLSKEEAEAAAIKRIKAERVVAVAGAMTITAAAAYVAYGHFKPQADGMIKAGKTLQRVEMQKTDKLHDAFYAAKNKQDKIKYAGKLGQTRRLQTGEAYLMYIGGNKDIKIAGNKTAQKTFERLYKSDPEFKKAAENLAKTNVHGFNGAGGNMKKMYENFNTNLIRHDDPAVKKFYSELKKNGYGAVRDINDMKFSGYKAKNPLIIFGSPDSVSVKTVKELTKDEVAKKLQQNGRIETAKMLSTQLSPYALGAMPMAALTMYSDDLNRNYIDSTNRKLIEERRR